MASAFPKEELHYLLHAGLPLVVMFGSHVARNRIDRRRYAASFATMPTHCRFIDKCTKGCEKLARRLRKNFLRRMYRPHLGVPSHGMTHRLSTHLTIEVCAINFIALFAYFVMQSATPEQRMSTTILGVLVGVLDIVVVAAAVWISRPKQGTKGDNAISWPEAVVATASFVILGMVTYLYLGGT